MKDFYIYILQVNIGLIVFYAFYRILFAGDTFLQLRRFLLVFVILLSFFYPLVSLTEWLEKREVLQVVVANYSELFAGEGVFVEQVETSLFTINNILPVIWLVGSVFLLFRLFIQIYSIYRLKINGSKRVALGTNIFVLKDKTLPFSFFGWIFICPDDYDEEQFQEIIIHEKAHANQWHSLDVLAGEILCVFFWFNPAVWLLRFEIRQNLEFLADKDVIVSGYDRKNYQYHLLRLSYQPTAVSIINNFNVSQLKKRILMMNKKKNSKLGLTKYALLFPITGLLILFSNAHVVAEMPHEVVIENKDISPAMSLDTNTVVFERVFERVEVAPKFPGGRNAMESFLHKNLKYPAKAFEQKTEGSVFLSFVVDKTGKVVNVNVFDGVSPELDAEAIRVVKSMPAWTPGMQRGQKVNVMFKMPIVFKLMPPSPASEEQKMKTPPPPPPFPKG